MLCSRISLCLFLTCFGGAVNLISATKEICLICHQMWDVYDVKPLPNQLMWESSFVKSLQSTAQLALQCFRCNFTWNESIAPVQYDKIMSGDTVMVQQIWQDHKTSDNNMPGNNNVTARNPFSFTETPESSEVEVSSDEVSSDEFHGCQTRQMLIISAGVLLVSSSITLVLGILIGLKIAQSSQQRAQNSGEEQSEEVPFRQNAANPERIYRQPTNEESTISRLSLRGLNTFIKQPWQENSCGEEISEIRLHQEPV